MIFFSVYIHFLHFTDSLVCLWSVNNGACTVNNKPPSLLALRPPFIEVLKRMSHDMNTMNGLWAGSDYTSVCLRLFNSLKASGELDVVVLCVAKAEAIF